MRNLLAAAAAPNSLANKIGRMVETKLFSTRQRENKHLYEGSIRLDGPTLADQRLCANVNSVSVHSVSRFRLSLSVNLAAAIGEAQLLKKVGRANGGAQILPLSRPAACLRALAVYLLSASCPSAPTNKQRQRTRNPILERP